MARYLAAILGGGTNDRGSVLEPATLATMFDAQYQPDPRIPGIGLAFFRETAGDHALIEHQGIVPGFNSEVFLAPDDGVGVMAFTNGSGNAMLWMPTELGKLLHDLLGVPEEGIRTDVPQRPEVWEDILGWYYLPGPITDARARSMLGAGVEVFVRRGELLLRFLTPVPALYRGFPLHPDAEDPFVFRVDASGLFTLRVVFSREPEDGAMAVHLDLMPLSAYKRPNATNPRRWAEGAAAVAGTAILARRRLTARRRLR
jgi:hypothetical protein